MKAKLDGMQLRITADTSEEQDWIREMARHRLFTFKSASVGAPPNFIELTPSLGWDYYDMRSSLQRLHAEVVGALSGIASFNKEPGEK